jgi:hypothetical protein
MPKMAPVVSEVTLDQFAANLSSYYQQAQGRGEHCKVEHFVRAATSTISSFTPPTTSTREICFEDER